MSWLREGDFFQDVTGPLGKASEWIEDDIEELKQKKILFVAGGVGTAPVYPQVKWLHEHGVDCDVIMGWCGSRCYRWCQEQRTSDPREGNGSCCRQFICDNG